ncbi:MAG: SDR family oxidoreductase [Gammaproteobacteria bacterium]|jgi:NAD(P)-dependent dehydrogenase (short-subunit alcohol dehydrogenase family)
MSEQGQRVFITGSASGLGRAMALRFAREGCRVAVADVNDARAMEAAEEVETAGGEALVLHCDITSDASVSDAAAEVDEAWGGVDVLINNAGVAAAGTVIDTPMEDWSWMIDTNLLGAVRMCRALVPSMQAQRSGYVINVASAAGIVQSPGMASYNVAKAGMIALSETLRNEVRRFGIGVTVVCPSFFATNLMESYRGPATGVRDMADKLMRRSSLDADDVADAVYRAMEKDELFVFAHNEARLAYHFKRLMPGVFYWSTERAAQKMFGDLVELEPDDR